MGLASEMSLSPLYDSELVPFAILTKGPHKNDGLQHESHFLAGLAAEFAVAVYENNAKLWRFCRNVKSTKMTLSPERRISRSGKITSAQSLCLLATPS